MLVGDDTEDSIITDIASKWSNLNVSIHPNTNKKMGSQTVGTFLKKVRVSISNTCLTTIFSFLSVEALVEPVSVTLHQWHFTIEYVLEIMVSASRFAKHSGTKWHSRRPIICNFSRFSVQRYNQSG